MRRLAFAATPLIALIAAPVLAAAPALSQERTMADVFVTAAHFCPRGSLPADGRVLQVASNQALFSLLGTAYGGDGRTTFALPNLTGRSAIGTGHIAGGATLRPGDVVIGIPAPDPELTELTGLRRLRRPENPGVYDLAEPLEHPDSRDLALDEVADIHTPPAPNPSAGAQLGAALGAALALQHCITVEGHYPARN